LVRYQTSVGRDLTSGLRLDRNERADNFPATILKDIFDQLPAYSLTASPEASSLYARISESISVSSDQIFVTAGITEGIRILYDLGCELGDNIVCIHPTYPMYEVFADMYGVEYRRILYDLSTLQPIEKLLFDNLDDRTRFVFLPNPNLPIESYYSKEKLDEFAKACDKYDCFLVIDEAYHFFGAPSALELIERHENVIVLRTFSKAYGLAGLRIGFMLSNRENIEYFSKSRSIVENNSLSMAIAEYMLKNPEIMLSHVRAVGEGAKYFKKCLDELGYTWHGGQVTNGILIFLENSEDSIRLVDELKKKNVYIRGGFETPYDRCVRVSLGRESQMKVVVDSMVDSLGGSHARSRKD
jgi:histidinol-phosphate aminotransferase